jgi:hypothetical protein
MNFSPLISTKLKLGFLSSKYFEKAPEFKLYKNSSEFNVQFKCSNENIILDETQFEILNNFNLFLFSDILEFSDFDNKIDKGFFLFINKGLI